MYWFHMGVIVLFAIVIVVFALQNLQVVTITFLSLTAGAPLALVAIVIYLLGMATGSSVWAALRRSIDAARRRGSQRG